MEIFDIKNLNYKYPQTDSLALQDINLRINEGELLLICGGSGCGKTTLLNHLKPVMTPFGERSGEILYKGRPLSELSEKEQASKIGYVLQDPQRQIVTDKVWHEMAFGLENLGLDTNEMHRRVAETANFFGIDKWFDRDVYTLSGGQKQLLNLACVMVMQPEILILDEPTASLDPVAASEFLDAVYRINSELGTTVIISEHRTELIFSHRDRVVFIKNGRIEFDASPALLPEISAQNGIVEYLPVPARVFVSLGENQDCPVDIKSGRQRLKEYTDNFINKEYKNKKPSADGTSVLVLKDVCFRYTKDSADILKDCCMEVPQGCLYAIMGGNGSGKSTLLKAIAGICKPYSGKVNTQNKKAVYLPQEVRLLFACETVAEELAEMTNDENLVANTARLCGIEDILDRHPYDISVGQAQKVALAKILLTGADILLLDEITRGLDAKYKKELATLLKKLCEDGKTVIVVSHDIEFCAEHADIAAMFFDGGITAQGQPRQFFEDSSFYTTRAVRMSRNILKGCVTAKDIINLCRENKAKI